MMTAGALVAVPAHASSTTQSAALSVETAAQRSWVHAVYRTASNCTAEGHRLVNEGFVDTFNCVWDSPYWALWVFD